MTVPITRLDMDAAAPPREAARHSDARAARRILAIAMVLDGAKRKAAAECCGMDRQTLRDWVHRYNAEGIEGLSNRKAPGRPAYLADGRKDGLADPVRQGPDPKQHGVVRRRPVDLKRGTENRFGAVMHGRTVGKTLARLGFRRLSVRPRHPKSDPEKQEAFKKNLGDSPGHPATGSQGQTPGNMVSG